jgi:membrane protease subunit (stomatin/prohibitin family)
MNEGRGNVYENKGSVFQERGQSGNVIENKGSYALTARMLLKLKVVSRWQVGKKRIQDPGSRKSLD